MPAGTRAQLGNELFAQAIYVAAVTYPTLGASASGSNTLTVQGVQVGDIISANLQAPPAHLLLGNLYVSAANTITILWSTDSTGISTGTVAVVFEITRAENAILGLTFLPTSIQ